MREEGKVQQASLIRVVWTLSYNLNGPLSFTCKPAAIIRAENLAEALALHPAFALHPALRALAIPHVHIQKDKDIRSNSHCSGMPVSRR